MAVVVVLVVVVLLFLLLLLPLPLHNTYANHFGARQGRFCRHSALLATPYTGRCQRLVPDSKQKLLRDLIPGNQHPRRIEVEQRRKRRMIVMMAMIRAKTDQSPDWRNLMKDFSEVWGASKRMIRKGPGRPRTAFTLPWYEVLRMESFCSKLLGSLLRKFWQKCSIWKRALTMSETSWMTRRLRSECANGCQVLFCSCGLQPAPESPYTARNVYANPRVLGQLA